MPLYSFKCTRETCGAETESIMKPYEKDGGVECSACGGKALPVITTPGGYSIKGPNTASTKPKGAGSWKK